MATNHSPGWYALHVKRNAEQHIVEHLTSKSVPTFLPLIECLHTRARRGGETLEPLFPGYLFVLLAYVEESPASWQAVRWAPGVRLILGCEGTPVPIPEPVMRALRQRVGESGFVRRDFPFQPGSRVRFRSGPMTGLDALFERPLSRAGRVRVLMSLLGRQTGIEVDTVDLDCA